MAAITYHSICHLHTSKALTPDCLVCSGTCVWWECACHFWWQFCAIAWQQFKHCVYGNGTQVSKYGEFLHTVFWI